MGAMILVCISNNLGIMWVAIETTTLVSAFLVGLYNKKSSVEAAWKYIIICTAGIVIALLGTIFMSLSINHSGRNASMRWIGQQSWQMLPY